MRILPKKLILLAILIPLQSFSEELRFQKKIHFTQGRFKVDSKSYKYINSNTVTIFKSKNDQIFEIEAIKSKGLTFYTLTVKRGETPILIINDFAVMSKSSKVRMLKEGWIEDLNGDGYFDIVQREKTFISNTRTPSSHYTNDKLRIKMWDSQQNLFIEKESTSNMFKKALKKYNFKLYTLHKGKVL
jgi:hypothetical protein